MQFTPQQLTGGPKYHHQVRIGNWSEDVELEEIKLKDYLKKKETGTLIVTAKQRQLEDSLQPAELSSSPEGILHFGMRVMLANHTSKGFLSVNPYDTVSKAYPAWMITTSASGNASVRNVFVVERGDKGDDEDSAVRYGQAVRLKLDPFAMIKSPAYLHSEMVTPMVAAKFSRHQEVVALASPIGETKWQIVHPDPNVRAEMEGEAVAVGEPLLIKHVQTGTFLASDLIPYHNVFGQECEVHGHTYSSLTKCGVLAGEAKGETEGALKKFGSPNLWTVLTATHDVAQGGEEGGLDGTRLPAEGGP